MLDFNSFISFENFKRSFSFGMILIVLLLVFGCAAPAFYESNETGNRLKEDNFYESSIVGSNSANGNSLGIWLWYLENTGYSSHSTLAKDIASLGIKRVYVKVADGGYNPSSWPEVNNKALVDAYKAYGLEVWAWAYNYPGNEVAQADALYYAAKTGYQGFVTDIEVEFDKKTTELHSFLGELTKARKQAVDHGYATTEFKIYCTTWGNPKDHGMRVDIIDQYVDAHMPQTYIEVWGSNYMANADYWVNKGTAEYRSLECKKPVHHIVSAEHQLIQAWQINEFINASGPETSLWRIPGGDTSLNIWNTIEAVNWKKDFSPSVPKNLRPISIDPFNGNKVKVVLKNDSNIALANFSVSLYINDEVYRQTINTISANSTSELIFSTNLTSASNYQVSVLVDSLAQINEITESDNRLTRSIFLSQSNVTIPDDITGNFAFKEISFMIENGFMTGYPDGTFKPSKTLTRAEFATIIAKALDPDEIYEFRNRNFSDINGHWAYGNIIKTSRAGFMSGYPDGSFKPDNSITRVEVIVALNSALDDVANGNYSLFDYFRDAGKTPSWASDSVMNAVNNSIVISYPDKTLFNPGNNADRAFAVATIYQLLVKKGIAPAFSNSYLVTERLPAEISLTLNIPSEIEVNKEVKISGTARGIHKIVVSIDGIILKTITIENGIYSFDYSFLTASNNRKLVVNGFSSSGVSLKQVSRTISIRGSGVINGVIQNVPYFYQYSNNINPGSSCQNTAMAMVLNYYGASVHPDDISGYYGTKEGQYVSGWERIFNSEASYAGISVRATGTEYGSITRVRELLAEGRPVVVHGFFTYGGHVVTLTGFDGTYYYVNDPAGKWSEQYKYGGYSGVNSTEGKYIKYHKSNLEYAVAPDGYVWMYDIR